MEEKTNDKIGWNACRSTHTHTHTHGNLIDKKQSMKNALLNIYARDG